MSTWRSQVVGCAKAQKHITGKKRRQHVVYAWYEIRQSLAGCPTQAAGLCASFQHLQLTSYEMLGKWVIYSVCFGFLNCKIEVLIVSALWKCCEDEMRIRAVYLAQCSVLVGPINVSWDHCYKRLRCPRRLGLFPQNASHFEERLKPQILILPSCLALSFLPVHSHR